MCNVLYMYVLFVLRVFLFPGIVFLGKVFWRPFQNYNYFQPLQIQMRLACNEGKISTVTLAKNAEPRYKCIYSGNFVTEIIQRYTSHAVSSILTL